MTAVASAALLYHWSRRNLPGKKCGPAPFRAEAEFVVAVYAECSFVNRHSANRVGKCLHVLFPFVVPLVVFALLPQGAASLREFLG